MNIFKYFDRLLSEKHSLLALKYSYNVEKILKKAYAAACARKDEPSKQVCAICEYPFAEKYLIPVSGTNAFHRSKTVCPRCLLLVEDMLCEKCRKTHIISTIKIYVLHSIVYFSSAETAKEIFPDRNIDSSRIALAESEFEYLCGIIGKPKYARNFPHGSMICEDCFDRYYSHGRYDLDGDIRYLFDSTDITPELAKIGCHIMFPDYSIIYDGSCDDSGIDKNIYIEKIRQHSEKNLDKLRELDITLAEDIPAYPHQSMEMGLDSRRRAKFDNAKWSNKNMEDMDTPIAAAEKMLVGGVQNSVEEFVFALSSKIDDMNEEETVIECTPVSGGCEVLVVISTEETLDENIIERMFRRYVIEKPIEHPYKIPWQRTSNRAKVNYQPSIKLDNIYVEADGSTLVITASVKFTFK